MSVLSGKPDRLHPMDFAMRPLRRASGFFALLVIAVSKKNLEWESWGKSLPCFNGSTAEGAAGHLQGTYRTMGKERRNKNRENRNTKTKPTV